MPSTAEDRAHLWDHEQGGKQPDEEDRRRDAATEHPVARDRFGRQVATGDAAVD
jgi:hypothetical protein